MAKYMFFEDPNLETGHGWRYTKHRLFLDKPDGDIMAIATNEDGEDERVQFACYSYFWITEEESFKKTKCMAADELRSTSIKKEIPEFKGVNDMEGHFEFNGTPIEIIKYLKKLGMTNI